MDTDRWVFEIVMGQSVRFTLYVVAENMTEAIAKAQEHAQKHDGIEHGDVVSAKKMGEHPVII